MQVGDTIEYNGEKYVINGKLVLMEWLLCENATTRRSHVIRIKDYLEYEAIRQRKLAETKAEPTAESTLLNEIWAGVGY